jgi:hypothetical protein
LNHKFLFLFAIALLVSFAIYRVVFSPVSVTFKTYPVKILTNSSSPITVDVFQINRLGFRVPFRHLDGKFVVNEGAERIDIVQEAKDKFIFKTRNSSGAVVILYYAGKVPFPVQIVLNIEGASLALTNHLSFSLG